MPEAAEVRFVSDVLSTAADHTITQGTVISGRYARSQIDLSELVGATIERIIVKGKLLIFALCKNDEVFAALSTLGMTGWWYRVDAKNPLPDAVKSYVRIQLELHDGSILTFIDPRNFGTFKITSWTMSKIKLAELGPDIMTPEHLVSSIALPGFKARVARFGRKQTVAEALLDQRIAAGCGNYIRADAMHWATISPLRPMSSLSDEELARLWDAMRLIAARAYRDESMLEKGEGFSNLCYGQKTGMNGGTIETYTDKNGRTVWYCPTEQF
jgi:formamidopyrimidine-DNA glycosylase